MSNDRSDVRGLRISFVAALVEGALGGWFLLDALHVKDPIRAADNDRVGKALFCVLTASFASVVSVVYAIHPLLQRDVRPMLCLLLIGWMAFAVFFDFASLLVQV